MRIHYLNITKTFFQNSLGFQIQKLNLDKYYLIAKANIFSDHSKKYVCILCEKLVYTFVQVFFLQS